jgi:anti-sigma factor RsiW
MNCQAYIRLISRELSELAGAEEIDELHRHLAGCPQCRREFEFQRSIHEALSRPLASPLPADFAERVLGRALADAGHRSRARAVNYSLPVMATATVTILVILYRAPIARALAPVFYVLGEGVGRAIAGLGSRIAEAASDLGRAQAVSGGRVVVAGQVTKMWGIALAALAATGWALSRAYAYLRR